MKKFRDKLKRFLYRNRRYEVVRQNDLNVLVETDNSRARRSEQREKINMFFTFISAVAAVIAAIFSALAYVNA